MEFEATKAGEVLEMVFLTKTEIAMLNLAREQELSLDDFIAGKDERIEVLEGLVRDLANKLDMIASDAKAMKEMIHESY